MFLDDEEKQAAADLLDALTQGRAPDPPRKEKTLALLRTAYEL